MPGLGRDDVREGRTQKPVVVWPDALLRFGFFVRAKRGWGGQDLGSRTRKAIDLKPGEEAALREDECAAERGLCAEEEVTEDVQTAGGLRRAYESEIDARAATEALGYDADALELGKKREGLGDSVFKHPAREEVFLGREDASVCGERGI